MKGKPIHKFYVPVSCFLSLSSFEVLVKNKGIQSVSLEAVILKGLDFYNYCMMILNEQTSL